MSGLASPSHPLSQHVMIVAGEASGDHHGARLVTSVLEKNPHIRFSGIGGEHMRRAGVDIAVDSASLAVVGLVEVLIHYPTLRRALLTLQKKLRDERPALLILIDYPDFNLRLAKTARELGIKVLYYISPQIWAWRQHRVHMIRERVNMMAVVFPFELPFYESAGVPVRFVGHPLAREVHSSLTRDEAAVSMGLDASRPIVGLFPGSRRSEIKRLMPLLLHAAQRVQAQIPSVQFILPVASTLKNTPLDAYQHGIPIDVVKIPDRFYDVIQSCDAIVSASGTATLEIALMEKPLLVIYQVNSLSYRIMSRLVRVDHIALCNIVAQKRIARELIQDAATPEAIAEDLKRQLTDQAYVAQMKAQFAEMKKTLADAREQTDISTLTLEMLAPDDHLPGVIAESALNGDSV